MMATMMMTMTSSWMTILSQRHPWWTFLPGPNFHPMTKVKLLTQDKNASLVDELRKWESAGRGRLASSTEVVFDLKVRCQLDIVIVKCKI